MPKISITHKGKGISIAYIFFIILSLTILINIMAEVEYQIFSAKILINPI